MKSSALYALAAAVLFGASTPFAKVLVGTVDPILLAALLYLGSGIGLSLTLLLRRALRFPSGESPVRAPRTWANANCGPANPPEVGNTVSHVSHRPQPGLRAIRSGV